LRILTGWLRFACRLSRDARCLNRQAFALLAVRPVCACLSITEPNYQVNIVHIALARFAKEDPMPAGNLLYYALVALVIALIAAFLGFGGVAGTAAGIAQILFYIFLVIFLVVLVMNFLGRGRGPTV
jgi:uncharacterized membrane protein YtjA (UPF0391 family)